MKTLFASAATALLTWLTAAPAVAAPPANLSIVSEQGQAFSLVLDGRLLTRPLARQVRVGQLVPGRHWAEFSVPAAYGPPMHFRTTVWLQPGLETDYVLVMRPYGPQLQQVGVVALGAPAYGQGSYDGPGNAPYGGGQGGYYGPGQPPAPSQGGYGNGGYDPRDPGQPQPYPAPTPPAYPGQQPPAQAAPAYPDNAPTGQPQPVPAYPDNSVNGEPQAAPAYPDNAGNAPAAGYPDTTRDGNAYPADPNAAANLPLFEPADIHDLAQDLHERSTDEERLRTATQALEQHSLRTDDLAELMGTFTHDESRIELARFSYAHLSNPQDFSRVYRALQFKSSIRALRQAVGLPQE